jgi:hypothetical protein
MPTKGAGSYLVQELKKLFRPISIGRFVSLQESTVSNTDQQFRNATEASWRSCHWRTVGVEPWGRQGILFVPRQRSGEAAPEKRAFLRMASILMVAYIIGVFVIFLCF